MFAFAWGKGELAKWDGPDVWQKEFLTSIRDQLVEGHKTDLQPILEAASSGHGTGKSVLVSWLILWALLTSDHVRGVVTANTDVQLRTKTWAELSKWFRLCFGADTILDMTATAIFSKNPKHEKTHRIDAIPWSLNRPEAVAGLHNSGKRLLIIFDESSAIPDIIWETQMGALTDKDTEIIWCVFGNPTRSDGSFHKCFQSGSRWSTRRVDSRSARASNKTELQFWIEAYGLDSDFVRMRVLGLPPRIADASFISSDVVEFAMKREISESATMHYPLVFGVDVARFGCHDDQTEVLTDSGWKLFSQLTGEERVFSRHSDGVADWQPITCVHRYRHSGSMVAYENERVNFCLTENHRMLSASVGSRRKARQIEPPNYVLKEWTSCSGSFISPRQVEWVGVRPAPFVFTDRRDMPYGGTRPGQTWKFAPEDWFSFLGWFISEGNVYYEKRVGGRHRVLIAQTNREKRVQIESLFSRMGIKYRITPTGNQIEFSIRAIADHLDSECGRGAPFKRIPGYVLNATPDLIEKFLDAYCDGDGSRRAGRRQVYATTSVKIADAIQELLVKLGRAGKISTAVKAGSTSKIHGRTITRQHDVHVVTELKNSRPLEIEKKKTKLITYDGWVHCVSTPHKTLLTRRKGCVLWSGNSDKSVVTARRGPKQVLLKKFRGLDTMQLASTVVDYWRTMGQNGSICVDGIGIGAGVVDRLRQLKLPVIDVNVAHEATKPREFGNVRSELYGIMKDWLPGASLINDEEQRLALIALQYGYNARMQLMMEKKDDLRRRGLPSPDEADALALTFAGETAVLGVRSAKVIPITQQKRIM